MTEEPEDKLIAAVRTGSIEAVQNALQAGERLETYSKYGETPLGVAAKMGDMEMMRFLSGLGVDLDEDDYEGDTPLSKAVWARQYEAVDWLLEQGTEEARVERGETALYCAAEFGDLELTRRLLARDINVNAANIRGGTPLMAAVDRTGWVTEEEDLARRRQVARVLLERGADVTLQSSSGVTAMYLACRLGDAQTVAMLRRAGAGIKLTEAAMLGDVEITRILLDAGESPNTPDLWGNYALCLAASNGHAAVARLLLERGADPYAVSEHYGETALSAAVEAGHFDVVSIFITPTLTDDTVISYLHAFLPGQMTPRVRLAALLLGRDQNIDTLDDKDDMTPLMTAVAHETEQKARLLLRAGADVNVQNKTGYTALMCAAQCGRVDMLRLLLTAGADVHVVNKNDTSALLCAAVEGAHRLQRNSDKSERGERTAREQGVELVRLLVEAGADVNLQTSYNRTALDYAIEGGHKDIADLLRAAGAKTSEFQ